MSRSGDPASASGWLDHPPRMGFLTDTSLCIGCKACEVACKQWNSVPEDGLNLLGSSYDNTGGLGASTWRHVAFIEQRCRRPDPGRGRRRAAVADVVGRLQALHPRRRASTCARPARCFAPSSAPSSCSKTSATAAVTAFPPARSGSSTGAKKTAGRGNARCATTACSTTRRPACAQACPTQSIQFGPLDELARAGGGAGRGAARARRARRPPLRRGPGRRGRRRGRVLPAARRARGLWASAGPGGPDA